MELWISVVVILLGIGGILFFCLRKQLKKPVRITGIILSCLIFLAAAGYAMLTFFFLDSLREEPPAAEIPSVSVESSEVLPSSAAEEATTETEYEENTAADEAGLSEKEIKKIAAARVDAACRAALADVYATAHPGESHVSFPFDPVRPLGRVRLNEEQAKIYDEIRVKVAKIEDFEYTAQEYGYPFLDNLLVAAAALSEDYPLYSTYFEIRDTVEGDTCTGIVSQYFLPYSDEPLEAENRQELKNEIAIFEAQCDEIVRRIPRELSVYDQYRYLAAYLSCTAYYELDAPGQQNSTPYGAIAGGPAICQGYSKAFEYLCEKADLYCLCVSGSSGNESHMWNLIQLEDGTYHVDVTWSDNGINLPTDPEWFQYFAVTQDKILEDHIIDDGTIATGQRDISPTGTIE